MTQESLREPIEMLERNNPLDKLDLEVAIQEEKFAQEISRRLKELFNPPGIFRGFKFEVGGVVPTHPPTEPKEPAPGFLEHDAPVRALKRVKQHAPIPVVKGNQK